MKKKIQNSKNRKTRVQTSSKQEEKNRQKDRQQNIQKPEEKDYPPVPESIKGKLSSDAIKRFGPQLESAWQQYQRITNEDVVTEEAREEIHKFQIEHLVLHSPYNELTRNSSILLNFQKVLQEFAKKWDELVRKDSSNQGSHIFFLTYADEDEPRVLAKNYNRYCILDRRLIAITVPEGKSRINYMPFLHEAGHFIGGRNRRTRKRLLVKLTVLCFLGSIYDKCIRIYDRIPEGTPIRYYNDNTPLGQSRKQFMQRILNILQPIYESLEPSAAKAAVEMEPIIGYDEHSERYISLVISFIVHNLKDRNMWEENLKQLFEKKYETDERILTILWTAGNDTLRDFSSKKNIKIKSMIDSYEEPVADCFMLNVGRLSFRRYLSMLLSQKWEEWNRTNGETGTYEEYKQYVLTSTERIRILSICFAKKVQPRDIYSVMDRINIFTKRRRFNRKARAALSIGHAWQIQETQDSFEQMLINPQLLISRYISEQVINHENYQKMEKTELKPIIEQIRAYKWQYTCLIQIRLAACRIKNALCSKAGIHTANKTLL